MPVYRGGVHQDCRKSGVFTPWEAVKLLEVNTKHMGHQFWGDEIEFVEVTLGFEYRLTGLPQMSGSHGFRAGKLP